MNIPQDILYALRNVVLQSFTQKSIQSVLKSIVFGVFSVEMLYFCLRVVYLHIELKQIHVMSTQSMQKTIADYFKSQPVVKAWLFGSFARGEETPLSDVDLLVIYDDKARVSLLKHCAIINDLESLLDRSVDLVEEGTLLPFAAESANRDKKLIYERTC